MSIRITGGTLRGRMVPSPQGGQTRPTGALARQALFNILQAVDDYQVLDLFAGSGIMGIEALSRGAAHVHAVENSRTQSKVLQKSYVELGVADQVTLLAVDALTLPGKPPLMANGFDLIYADPPFTKEYPDLRVFLPWLTPGGYAIFEAPSRSLPAWASEASDQRRYGESTLLFFNMTF